MFHSKKKLLVVALLPVLLVGCWKPSKKDDPNNGKTENEATASFLITKVEGDAITPNSQGRIWKVAGYKEFKLRACVEDRKARVKVTGHRFIVEVPDEKKKIYPDEATDPDGCFQWSENIPYNPWAEKSTYIEVRRRIYGEGVQVGFRDVCLYLNPWSGERGDRSKAVIYCRTGQVSPTQVVSEKQNSAALMGQLGKGAATLWMEDIAAQVSLLDETDSRLRAELDEEIKRRPVGKGTAQSVVNEEGALLEVLLSMKPKIRVEGLDGNPEYIELKSGQFKVWVTLVAANVGENRDQSMILTPNLLVSDGKIFGSKLETAVKMGLSRRVSRGRLEMAIRVQPVGVPANTPVRDFEALYVLGDIQNLFSTRPFLSPKFTQSPEEFQYDRYLKSTANYESLRDAQMARKFEPFIFETATVMFAGIRPGETATTRTVEYKVQTCVRDALTGVRVPKTVFHVFDDKGKEILDTKVINGKTVVGPPVTTDDGCLIWNSSLTHKYYKPEEFFFPSFKIKQDRMERAVEKNLVMNPWDAMFRTFGFDRVEFMEDFIAAIKKRDKIESRFFIPRYSYHALRFRYEIDRFMELEVKKLILLNLRPEVLRYSGIIGGRKVTEPLRDGIYLMKVAIQKDYLDPADKGNSLMPGRDRKGDVTTVIRSTRKPTEKHFITVVKKLVRVNSGEINTPVEFAMQDLRLMRIRSQFLVELEPIDEQQLHLANVLIGRNQAIMRDIEKTREMKDEERRAYIADYRAKTEGLLAKLKAKLTTEAGGLMDPDKIGSLELDPDSMKQFRLNTDSLKPLLDEMEKTLRLNDFTIADTAPGVSFDKFIEEDAGLKKRTFVGPIIFLSNAYSDDLRPTDILQLDDGRCLTSDCDELKAREAEGKKFRNAYDTSKYFGSVAHLAGVQVDDLIAAYLSDREQYKTLMPAISSLANFADLYNLQLVMLSGEQLTKVNWACSGTVESCTQPAGQAQLGGQALVDRLNSSVGQMADLNRIRDSLMETVIPRRDWPAMEMARPVTLANLKALSLASQDIERPSLQPISLPLGERLCRFYASDLSRLFPTEFRRSEMTNQVYSMCFRSLLASRTRQSPFALDYKVRVFSTGEYVFKGGKQMNLNVGANFNLNHSTDFKVSTGAGVNFADFIPMIGALGRRGMPGGGEKGLDFSKPFSIKLGADLGSSRSRSDGTGISESTYLVMQSANFAIQLSEYERCTIVKMGPQLLQQISSDLQYYFRTDEEKSQLARAVHRGLMVCSGEHEKKAMPVTESYYYFTQHFTEGDMLDQADLYNHPWLLAMRGVRDFATFVHLIRAQEFSLFQPFTKIVDKAGWPLDQLVDAYRAVVPTFPGLYTVLKPGEGLKEYPFDQTADEAFVR